MHNEEPRMELRALLAVILSMAVLASYQYFFVPPPEELPEVPTAAPGPAPAGGPGTSAAGQDDAGTPAPAPGGDEVLVPPPTAAAVVAQEETQTTVVAEDFWLTISNRGARITSFVLPAYRDEGGGELDLVGAPAAAAGHYPLEWRSPFDPGVAAALNDGLFVLDASGGAQTAAGLRPTPDSPVRLRFEWSDGQGRSASKELVLPANGNILELRAAVAGFEAPVFVGLGAGLDEVQSDLRNAYLAERALAYGDGGLEQWAADDLATPVTIDGPTWAGVESHYFLGAFLLDGDLGAPARVLLSSVPVQLTAPPEAEAEEAEPLEHVLPAAALAVGELEEPVAVYFGPKKYDQLGGVGHSLQEAVDFGLWGFISKPLLFVLNTIYSFVANYGLAIMLLTALLRLAFWPLNQKAMTSMRKTQKLQPQMAAIRAKYKGAKDLESRQKMNDEVMALYKREGVSPLGGCLPMLAQIPILFSFYALLSVAIELRQAPFLLWIDDLSRHDPYLVLPLLMGGSMFVQQRLTPTNAADPQQASMMRMMRLMPIFFTVMFLYVPSGLVLYWLVNNVLGIGQQLYVNRSMERQAEADKAARKAAKTAAKQAKKAKKGQRGNS